MVDVELAALMRSLLAPGGAVDFRTDVPAYARRRSRPGRPRASRTSTARASSARIFPEVLSTRERRYAVTGQPVFRARFVNPAPPAESPAALAQALQAEERSGREWRDVRRK